MKSLIYIEIKSGKPVSGSLELITLAKSLGEGVAAVIGGACEKDAAKISAYGVEVRLAKGKDFCQDQVLKVLETMVKEEQADAVWFAATQVGKDVAPRLAARLKTGCVTDVIAAELEEEGLVLKRPAYGGTVLERMKFAEGKAVIATVRSGSFAKPETGETKSVTVKAVPVSDEDVKAKLVKTVVEITELVNLEGADVVVAGGRGCGTKEVFGLVEELAKELGGVVGASRPAIEAGWVSRAHQVGQSGKNVAPKLYIACGISGAMQHVSGITSSDYIVAVNKDEDAAIFDVADVGIVGKCEEILPLMIEAVRQRR